jgi:winged helix DNA-binding protein
VRRAKEQSLRLTAQLLAGPRARSPLDVVTRLLAVQGQDLRGARLAVRARSRGLSVADLDRALTDERTVLITWVNRGTLHLVASEDYPWLHALTTPPLFTANARRLSQEGVTRAAAERGVKTIKRALADEGPLTRLQLRDRIAAARVPTKGQALVHLLMLASLRGIAVRGPIVGKQHAYALVHDWLGAPPPVDRESALAELARRYLAGHGPAGDRDLAQWAGLPLRDARAGLQAIASELVEREDGLVDLASRAGPARLPRPRLLGAFDPLLLGWRSREPVIGANERSIIGGGLFRPFALVDGRAAATWSLAGGEVKLEPFARLEPAVTEALARDAKDVVRYLGPHAGAASGR